MELHLVESLARDTMSAHGLPEKGWAFGWITRGSRRLGSCNHSRKQIRLLRSKAALAKREELEQVLLHEVAHALTPGENHGPVWLITARSIGYRGGRTASDSSLGRVCREAELDDARDLGLELLSGVVRPGRAAWFIARGDLHTGRVTSGSAQRCRVDVAGRTWRVPIQLMLVAAER